MSGILDVSDGTFGVIGLLFGLLDMGMNHCPNEGCLAANDVQAYNTVSIGETYFQQSHTGEELYYRRDTGKANGPFQHIWGFSASKFLGFSSSTVCLLYVCLQTLWAVTLLSQ